MQDNRLIRVARAKRNGLVQNDDGLANKAWHTSCQHTRTLYNMNLHAIPYQVYYYTRDWTIERVHNWFGFGFLTLDWKRLYPTKTTMLSRNITVRRERQNLLTYPMEPFGRTTIIFLFIDAFFQVPR